MWRDRWNHYDISMAWFDSENKKLFENQGFLKFLIEMENRERSAYDFGEIGLECKDYTDLKNAALYIAFLKNP